MAPESIGPAEKPGDVERTIHRIEAFSDIVMGFCLAEIGLGLSIPRTGDNANLGGNVFAFVASFSLVVMLWWNHHRLFRTYLVLTRATLFMNFALLGGLVLMLYFLQIGTRDIEVQGGGPYSLFASNAIELRRRVCVAGRHVRNWHPRAMVGAISGRFGLGHRANGANVFSGGGIRRRSRRVGPDARKLRRRRSARARLNSCCSRRPYACLRFAESSSRISYAA